LITYLAFPDDKATRDIINKSVVSALEKPENLKIIMQTNKHVGDLILTSDAEKHCLFYSNTAFTDDFKKVIKGAVGDKEPKNIQYWASLRLHSENLMLEDGCFITDIPLAPAGQNLIISNTPKKESEAKTVFVSDVLDETKKERFGVKSYPPSSSVGIYLGIAIGVILLIVICIIVIIVVKRRRRSSM